MEPPRAVKHHQRLKVGEKNPLLHNVSLQVNVEADNPRKTIKMTAIGSEFPSHLKSAGQEVRLHLTVLL